MPVDKLEFVIGSDYQLSPKYTMDNYRLCSILTEHDAKKAGAEVVKQVESPIISSLLYPGLQALDEEYLGCDIQFGGVDQRKIFTFAELYLPRLGYRKRAHLMNAMVPGLAGGKMSSSDPNSKIDFLDAPNVVSKKIKAAYCCEGDAENNGLLSFLKAVVFPIAALQRALSPEKPSWFADTSAPEGTIFSFSEEAKFGTPAMHFSAYDELHDAFARKEIHPSRLKAAMTSAINTLLRPIQDDFASAEEWKAIEQLAYPPAVPEKKKTKEKVRCSNSAAESS